jgi:glycosyltransferase involved in cell wall biosynthesis
LAPQAGVTFVGRVADVPAFLSDAWVVGVPVVRGVGAPVKLTEAMATGVPVLATVDGAGGAPCEAAGMRVSDDAGAWVDWIEQVVGRPDGPRADARERRVRTLADQSWSQTTRPLCQWLERA